MAAVGQRRKRPLQPPPGTRLWLTPPDEDLFCDFCGEVFRDEVRPRCALAPAAPR